MKKTAITDRGKRYRAQRNVKQTERRCIYCYANPPKLDVEHVNGDESDGRPDNLALACRSCNTLKGAAFVRAGIGIRTVQMNPAHGATTLAAWRRAVNVLLGFSRGSLLSAVSLVRSTPISKRVEFARQARAAARIAVKENPGAPTYEAWAEAISASALAKKTGGPFDKRLRKLIHDTPFAKRSEFNRETLRRRWEKEVPF